MRDDGRGMRSKLRDDVSDRRADSPRRLNRPIADYLEGDVTSRPLMGLHRLARVSEYFLYCTRNGKRAVRRFAGHAETLFFSIRQKESYILNHSPASGASEKQLSDVASFNADVQKELAMLYASLRATHTVPCPFCNGRGSVEESKAAEAIRIVKELVKAGKLRKEDVIG